MVFFLISEIRLEINSCLYVLCYRGARHSDIHIADELVLKGRDDSTSSDDIKLHEA